MKRCQVSTCLPAPAQAVWQAVKRPSTLFQVTRGMLGFSRQRRFPVEWQAGQRLRTRLWFFHLLPMPFLHRLEVVQVDEAGRTIRSHETSPFYTWDHTILVEEQGEGTSYTDTIDIQAGWLTWPIWLFANIFYHYRQWRWRKLAKSL
jgi:ligand-binding SRPBCC domain-containing protein